jgi:HK97 family phage major capsid protein
MKIRAKTEPVQLSFRDALITCERGAGQESDQVIMSVSSETPCETYAYYNDSYQRIFEILDHQPSSCDMSRCADGKGLVIRDNHRGDQIGLMLSPKMEGGKIRGAIEFCSGQRAQEIKTDALKGLRRNVSIGYVVDPSGYVAEGEQDGSPVVRAKSWMLYHAAFVPDPADPNVGVGRSVEENQPKEPKKVRSNMSDPVKDKLSAENVSEMFRMARHANMEPGTVDDHIKSGKGMDEFRGLFFAKLEQNEREAADAAKKAKETGKPEMPAREVGKPVFDESETKAIGKRYSIINVLRAAAGIKSDIGFEREVSDEASKRSGKSAQGILIPHEAPMACRARDLGMSLRAGEFQASGNGSNMIATNLMAAMFIDVLRPRMTLGAAGAQILSGLVGDIAIPKMTASATGYWINGEGQAPSAKSTPTIGQIPGTPHTAGAYTDITRKLLIQSSVDAQALVQNDLINVIARLMDAAGFAGTGANGQPKGLKLWDGINNPTVTKDAATYAQILAFMTAIENVNATFDNQSWIMRPTVMGQLANTPRLVTTIKNAAGAENVGGSGWGTILDPDTKNLLGFPYQLTTNVPTKSLWFGAWQHLIMALWTGMDIVVDPYSNSTTGTLRVVALQDCDIMCRYPQAFSYNDDVVTA